ncbi:hypothetical protein CHLRE_10g457000v5 [Chlamydomonas reinhardtii]|uniref:Peptidylprolyl isomerase n=1 Tax=Chlamydomonas reinhardtii TaxID=3055 RepID=A0A2K3DBL2_CHLRE|nr:uncharacterized protein CHLRE_10g457000v5 [Chlamydomonas reinhardtii]PNW77920.1 hypothetical protein CHLRE_10g457000v5 [Chlamydomonas reinhardtii]
MGKKQHQKDRMFLTTKEWKEEWGGHKGAKAAAPFKRLPFHCCAINFTPFEDPVCTDDGTVYDIASIVPYIMKFKKHPVSGEPLALKDLTRLNFSKNGDGEWNCPVMGKVFTEHTHIVAIKTTGNVYCWEAVEELNVKPKNWKDLLTDEPFTRKDIIHIQDPLNLTGRTIDQFDHVKRQLTLDDDEGADGAAVSNIRNATDDMKRALGALNTSEAKNAFATGGGGKRVEAARLLAEAKAKAGGAGAGGAGAGAGSTTAAQERQTGSGAPSTSGPAPAAAAGAGGGDWRLRAPERNTEMPAFKPGAVTWDTDDKITPAAAPTGGKGKGKGGGGGAGAAAKPPAGSVEGGSAANGGKPSPSAWYEAQGHVKYVESAQSTGATSRSFTSTAWAPSTKNDRARTRLQRTPTKKGYVRLHTNLGDLNVELHCDLAPRTCENFLALCDMGYYDNTPFHRSIKNFMIQGGDPTGSGKGGESIFGPTFKDELDSRLVHAGRGVLSMANSGPNTNGSQFFITFKSCRHLDFKHSVFGRVVGGLDILSAMEKTPTDPDDCPTSPITITGATVFTNPFYELEEEERKAEAAERKKADAEAAAASDPILNKVGTWYSKPGAGGDTAAAPAPVRSGVGKYIAGGMLASRPAAPAAAPAAAAAAAPAAAQARMAVAEDDERPVKKAKPSSALSNFDTW